MFLEYLNILKAVIQSKLELTFIMYLLDIIHRPKRFNA